MTSATPDTPENGARPDAGAPLDGRPGPIGAADGTDGGQVAGTPQVAAHPAAPDATDAPGAAPADRPAEQEVQRRLVDPSTVRRAPRFGRFILLGVALGGLVSLALALFSEPSELAGTDLFWLLFLSLGSIGGLAGAVVAVLLDRRSLRHRGLRTRPAVPPAPTTPEQT